MCKAKLLLNGLFLTALALPLVNCGGSAHEPAEAYYLIAANTKIPYWQAAAAGLAQAGGEMKVKFEMLGPDTYDPKAEAEELQKTVRQRKPSGILVSAADSELLKPEIDAAIAAGIPVITMDSDSPSSKRLTFIGTNNYGAGQMGAAVLVKQLQGKGSVVFYTMPEQANLRERLHGYEEVLRTHPGIKIVETVDIKGDARVAFDRTTEYIDKKTPVDAFVCLEALACPEVAEVLSRKEAKGKVVVAMDTDPRTLEWIQKGMIAATIAQKPYTMAYFGAKVLDMIHHQKPQSLATNWAQDTRSPMPNFIDTGATLIDKGNVDGFQKANAAARPYSVSVTLLMVRGRSGLRPFAAARLAANNCAGTM
jgi:ribose transport system substrate-binding protein